MINNIIDILVGEEGEILIDEPYMSGYIFLDNDLTAGTGLFGMRVNDRFNFTCTYNF